MELEQILDLPGIKLFDTNALGFRESIGVILYDCKSADELPLERLAEEIRGVEQNIAFLSRDNVFSIEEVAREKEYLLLRINRLLKFHSFNTRGKREPTEQKALDLLNQGGKEILKLIRIIRRKDITATFSDSERELYRRFIAYFVYISQEYELKSDYRLKHGLPVSRVQNDFQTDEKLVSAQLTLACTRPEPAILISCDGDTQKMLTFFYVDEEHKKRFGVHEPGYKVALYSDFGRGTGFKLQPLRYRGFR